MKEKLNKYGVSFVYSKDTTEAFTFHFSFLSILLVYFYTTVIHKIIEGEQL